MRTAQVSRLRETLIKIAAKVSVSARRILVELAAHCPLANDIQVITQGNIPFWKKHRNKFASMTRE